LDDWHFFPNFDSINLAFFLVKREDLKRRKKKPTHIL
jgi:hypothetical protein